MENNKAAQILVITLLVLTVLAVTIIGVIIIINRDTSQVVSNQKYEQIYNASEVKLRELLSKYGDYTTSLNDLSNDPDFINCELQDSSNNSSSNISYVCEVFSNTLGIVDVNTVITVSDTKSISNLEIKKDNTFTFNVTDYKSEISFTWDKDSSMEFQLLYQDPQGKILSINDVYNGANIFESPQNYNYETDIQAISSFNFEVSDPQNLARSTRIDFTKIEGFNSNPANKALSLSITPRTRNDESVFVNLTPQTFSTFPAQIRSFEVESIDPTDLSTPQVNLKTEIGLFPQTDTIWDYSLLTNELII